MLYLLALICAPLAVLLAGKPFQAVVNASLVVLGLLLLVVGVGIPLLFIALVHGLFVVHNYYSDKRTARLTRALERTGTSAEAFMGEPDELDTADRLAGSAGEIVAKGINGTVELSGERLLIVRSRSWGLHGVPTNLPDREYSLVQIEGVDYRDPAPLASGYISFVSSDTPAIAKDFDGRIDAVADPDAVMFNMFQKREFEMLRHVLEERLIHAQAPKATADDIIGSLERLAKLRTEGAISDEEHERLKQVVLDRAGNRALRPFGQGEGSHAQ